MKRVLFVVALALPLIGGVSLAADFNGDGTNDIGIFRPGSGLWAIRRVTRVYFGSSNDYPMPGDYNGDGVVDIGVFRPGSGLWAVRGVTRVYFGSGSDEAKPGDYNGDGTYDIGIFHRGSGLWAIRGITRVYYGTFGDLAIPGKQCRLPVTGQTTPYRTGDDGDHEAGAAFNYQTMSIGGDLVTVDHNTGLMWATDGNHYGCNWGQQTDWDAAIDWCNNLDFAGYTDWRLPNVKELQSIIDYGTHYPAIDITYFINTKSDPYWSSTTGDGDPDGSEFAWRVHFHTGEVYAYYKTVDNYVRAVRGGE